MQLSKETKPYLFAASERDISVKIQVNDVKV